VGKVRFINDSKATNADAVARALVCFSDIFWIAGGRPKEGGIDSLLQYAPRVRKAYLIGEAAEMFAQTLNGHAPYEIPGTLEDAIAAAFADASRSGVAAPVVLLSPACASFDQFATSRSVETDFAPWPVSLPGLHGESVVRVAAKVKGCAR